jgi:hypothetical protein
MDRLCGAAEFARALLIMAVTIGIILAFFNAMDWWTRELDGLMK